MEEKDPYLGVLKITKIIHSNLFDSRIEVHCTYKEFLVHFGQAEKMDLVRSLSYIKLIFSVLMTIRVKRCKVGT